ncbi:MAG: cytochrome c-type biogenesis protein CcmH [Dinoroseobacter sp.]|nr:cytochrome c-type biogenesis protein CcmH [Dinoroseobacter sp.]
MRVIALTLALLVAMPSFAVEPDEILDDPVLEERARDLSAELRCLVCRNESIDESNAELARDLRLLVRERLLAGDTDDEVIAFLVERYGEYVLLRPSTSGSSILLWLAGPLMLLIAVGVGIGYIRGRKLATDPVEALSAEDQARLKALLKDE